MSYFKTLNIFRGMQLLFLYNANNLISYCQTAGGSSSRGVDKSFQGLTVDRLRALLKEKGLSHKGKKASAIVLIVFYTTIQVNFCFFFSCLPRSYSISSFVSYLVFLC